MDIKKSSGLILHPSSLPGEYGIGDLGYNSFNFIDLLKSSKTNIWQVLPLGITDEVEYSPYSSKSSILGNPYLISINDIENNMFDKDNLNNLKELSTYEVEFKKVYSYKQSLFQSVSKRIDLNDSIYSDFLNKNELIKKHLTFVTLSEVHGNNWVEWDKDYLNYSEDTFQKVIEKFKDTFAKNVFLQYEFNSQWKKLKNYANLNNVSILGDIPIYVNHNSADVWLNKDLFDLDENNQMGYVSGAVPDDFTVEGQIWNTALYDWDNHNETDYSYWIEKLNENFAKIAVIEYNALFGPKLEVTVPNINEFSQEVERIAKAGYIELPTKLADNLVIGCDEEDIGHKWWLEFDDVKGQLKYTKKLDVLQKFLSVGSINKFQNFFNKRSVY